MQVFTIPGKLPGINDLFDEKQSKFAQTRSQSKKAWEQTVMWHARAARIRKLVGRARFVFRYVEPDRKRDPDNIAGGAKKIILDALVKLDVLTDDSMKYVAGWEDEFEIDPARPRVEVHIIEVP